MEQRPLRDRFFQDHARKIVMDERGRTRVEYVYEGDYYTAELTDRQWNVRKAGLLALLLASAALLLSAMMTEIRPNHAQDVVLMEAVTLFLLLGDCVGMASRLAHGRRLQKQEYRLAVKTLTECSFLAVCVLAALLLDLAVSLLAGRWAWEPPALGFLVRVVLLLAAQLGAAVLVRRERYATQASHDMPHGIDITNDFVNF